LPFLYEALAARIANVSSGVGSLTMNSDPPHPPLDLRPRLALLVCVQGGSQRDDGRHGNRAGADRDQGQRRVRFTKTDLNNYAGSENLEEGAREVARVALLGLDSPTGAFTHARLGTLEL
jgi:hypothetical protein